MYWLFAASSTILSIRGRGKLSFGQALFRSVKFIHILHLPLFFLTGTVLASQVGYLTSRMTFASSRRWTSALTAAAFSSDILRGICFQGLATGLISRRCSTMSLLTPRKSLADQVKTSLSLFRKSSSSSSSFVVRVALIFTTLSGRCLSKGILLTSQPSSKVALSLSHLGSLN